MKLRFLAAVCLLTIVTGCAGGVSTKQSDFDGHTEVFLDPAPVRTPGALMNYVLLGAHWHSANPETVQLIAGTIDEIVNIRAEDGLQFSINGEVTKLSSQVAFTEHDLGDGYGWKTSSRTFTATLPFVETLAATEGAKIKLLISQINYYEGYLNNDPGSAYQGLQKFLEEVHKAKAGMQSSATSPRESAQSAGLSD